MTDNEIIKALECCADEISRCYECPYDSLRYSECYELITRNAFDLINRQKAEIERLNEQIKDLNTIRYRLIESSGALTKITDELYQKIKAVGVKEFADRLNTALSEFDLSSVGLPDYDRGYEDCMTAVKDTFDNLVKEMIGSETE